MEQKETLRSLLDAKKTESMIFDLIEEAGGEISETLDRQLQKIEVELPQKIDGYFYFQQALESRQQWLQKQIDMMQRLQRGLMQAQERVSEYMEREMRARGLTELMGETVRFKLQKAAKRTVIDDEAKIPAKYFVIKTTKQVDKTMLKKDLEAGAPVEGAHLEDSEYLRAYLRTGK